MLVYSDPSFETTARALARELSQDANNVRQAELDHLRGFLIKAGQLEQAMEDARASGLKIEEDVIQRAVELTNGSANLFYARWAEESGAPRLSVRDCAHAVEMIRRALGIIEQAKDTKLTVKIPEGFQFYALFPEQYCAATFPQRIRVTHSCV
jgi:hypothetical protein